ncbi:hypothetical protein GR212_15510 [Rhizobium lusitanum]|uniref:Uncharacterized protein n=1 Tax=Rhizobium lusitanum TaxID=293958 RepID=A0A6L9UA53_9HYPH|nr:hypothetical protein [Rhizobium lusitanum]NEI70987.1 hypothetical protein [Rhizobium lusitanum]
MASAINKATVAFSTTLTLNESEIQALEALVCYGADSFLKVFKENLGTAYIRNHEEGIRSLFDAINRDVRPAHRKIVEARQDLIDGVRRRSKKDAKRQKALNLRIEQSNGTDR